LGVFVDTELDVLAEGAQNLLKLTLCLEEIEGSPWFNTSGTFQLTGTGEYVPLGNAEDGPELGLVPNKETPDGRCDSQPLVELLWKGSYSSGFTAPITATTT
jgi:hypothetical protein